MFVGLIVEPYQLALALSHIYFSLDLRLFLYRPIPSIRL